MAVIGGAVSGNLEIFDFDSWEIYLAFLEAAQAAGLGDLVDRIRKGYEERTPKGVHLPYRCSEISGNTKLARIFERDERGEKILDEKGNPKINTLIETRGEGGYAIIAPSNGLVHPSGKPYTLLQGNIATIATITPGERATLFQLARTFGEPISPGETRTERETKERSTRGDRPGDRFNLRASWEEILEPHGWTKVYERTGVTYWRRPGKAQGVSATTNFAGSDLLYVFSTSTLFESERGYSKFSVYAVLNHGGN